MSDPQGLPKGTLVLASLRYDLKSRTYPAGSSKDNAWLGEKAAEE